MNEHQVNRHTEARKRVVRVREVELDTLRDLVAMLDDHAAARFAALERATADGVIGGWHPTPHPRSPGTGEGRLSSSGHADRGFSRGAW